MSEQSALRKIWKKELPSGWITRFIEEGLIPLLQSRGYKIRYTPLSAVRYCGEWAFSHKLVKEFQNTSYTIVHKKNSNQGTPEEQDWFFRTILTDDWIALCEKWSAPEFLDDSDVGYAQRMDLPDFAWRLVLLNPVA